MARDVHPSAGEQPSRDDVLPESYALYVTETTVAVWQFRPTVSDPSGTWHHIETLDQDNKPRFTLEYATVEAPVGDGYWIYTKSYDCAMDCE